MINLSREDIAAILRIALRKGGDFADLYVTETENGVIGSEEGRIQRFYSGESSGAGLRILKGDFSAYFHTSDLSIQSLKELAAKAGEAVKGGVFAEVPKSLTPQYDGEASPELELKALGQTMRQVNEYGRSLAPEIKQVVLSCSLGRKNTLIGNSQGRFVMNSHRRQRFFVKVIGEKDGQLQTAIATLGDTCTTTPWDAPTLEAKVAEAANRVLLLLGAKPAPSGPMTVILSSTAGGTMVHEACGHGLEGDHIAKGLSVYGGKLGKTVASPKITVIDDATLAGKYGSYTLDDEGEPGRKNVLIEGGVLRQYMYDIRSARLAGCESTGNGRRESYRCVPQVRMSNTYIAPGQDQPEAILADTHRGLFVKKMGGGQVNTANGDFVFEVSEGYIIENGKLTYPVKNATLIGNGPKVLNSVFAVGSDLGFAIGTCGKGGQSVPVGDAQPTLGLTDVIVGGTA